MSRFETAIVGMGILGKLHTKAVISNDELELTAVCDICEAQMDAVKEENPGIKVFTDCDSMFRQCDIDVAIIATQDPYHKEPVLAACKHGVKYILCEKPFMTSVADAKECIAAAEAEGAQIYVLYVNRFAKGDRAIRILTENGILGDIQHGELRVDDNIEVPLNLWGKASKDFAVSSSPLQFLFSHTIDQLRFHMSPAEIAKVYAIGRQEGTGSVYDYAEALVTLDNGAIFRLKTEWTRYMPTLVDFYLQMTGSQGGYTYNRVPSFNTEQGLRFDFREFALAEKGHELLQAENIVSHIIVNEEQTGKIGLLVYEEENPVDRSMVLGHIIDFIKGDRSMGHIIPTAADGLKQVIVMDAIFESIKSGKMVKINY